ncbi:hypothetical protein EMWEY_00055620 [Eimeria maxima]|uniref:Uncharacterized protein n=1 Tax=Eimeria maxima TaxID=5804 RepID=U6M4G2_EIMMA|nr:hypothetical protein EMWEY_00055620 [Eimeria maxima]CDJ59092.1 hypothetical protein EMWEY_00055620 [Eimeria maxima]
MRLWSVRYEATAMQPLLNRVIARAAVATVSTAAAADTEATAATTAAAADTEATAAVSSTAADFLPTRLRSFIKGAVGAGREGGWCTVAASLRVLTLDIQEVSIGRISGAVERPPNGAILLTPRHLRDCSNTYDVRLHRRHNHRSRLGAL